MKKSIIDEWISEEIRVCGKEHILFRYSIMKTELEQSIHDIKDSDRASVLSDVLNIVDKIIDGIKQSDTTK